MSKKIVTSLMIAAMSVSMLAGCGNDKEVTKVDDNTVQITDVSTEADNSTEETTEVESTEEVTSSGDIVEELGINIKEGDYFSSYIDVEGDERCTSFIAGIKKDDEYTDETMDFPIIVTIYSTEYPVEVEDRGSNAGGNSVAVTYLGSDISLEPSKEGYVKTLFNCNIKSWNSFTAYWSVYDKTTGTCLIPSSHFYEEDGEREETVTVTVDGVEYDCYYESSFNNKVQDGSDFTYITVAVEHPADYDSSNIVFVVSSETATSAEYVASLEEDDDDTVGNLCDDVEVWALRNGTYYSYKARN